MKKTILLLLLLSTVLHAGIPWQALVHRDSNHIRSVGFCNFEHADKFIYKVVKVPRSFQPEMGKKYKLDAQDQPVELTQVEYEALPENIEKAKETARKAKLKKLLDGLTDAKIDKLLNFLSSP